jgi:hypothetical protein
MTLDHAYYIACVVLLVLYLLLGDVIWRMVRARLALDVHGLVMAEQERNGHFAMLIPKFTVIALWPLVGMLAVTASILASLRSEAPTL